MFRRNDRRKKISVTSKLGKDFLDMTPEVESIRERVGKLGFIEIKNFCCLKETFKRMKNQFINWKKAFTNYVSDKGTVSWIDKELPELKKSYLIWKMRTRLGQIFAPKGATQRQQGTGRCARCCTSSGQWEVQPRWVTTKHPLKCLKFKNTDNTTCF